MSWTRFDIYNSGIHILSWNSSCVIFVMMLMHLWRHSYTITPKTKQPDLMVVHSSAIICYPVGPWNTPACTPDAKWQKSRSDWFIVPGVSLQPSVTRDADWLSLANPHCLGNRCPKGWYMSTLITSATRVTRK